MSERQGFVAFAAQEGATISRLCEQFGIGRKTGYKWLARAAQGEPFLVDRSRRPHTSPRTHHGCSRGPGAETACGTSRLGRTQAAPCPGAPGHGAAASAEHHHHHFAPPSSPRPGSLATRLRALRTRGAQPAVATRLHGPPPLDQDRVHPLTLLDDHSRFALTLTACANEQALTVKPHLRRVFQHFGLPRRLLCDNGSPWAPAGMSGLTSLEAWLLQLGIDVWHGRPYHPQTQGKVERFHRTIAAGLRPAAVS